MKIKSEDNDREALAKQLTYKRKGFGLSPYARLIDLCKTKTKK